MNDSAPPVPDSRAQDALHWALACLKIEEGSFAPASADASFRRYFRLTHDNASWIVMDAPPAHEDCRPFVRIAGLLARWGLNVPQVLAADLERGFLLLSDLGRQTFLQVMDEANADTLFDEAIDALVRMQKASLQDPETANLPAYDAALLQRELQLFPDWYLRRHLGVTLGEGETAVLGQVFAQLVASALHQPRCFVHRDYMPRNLMFTTPSPGILDFQDAVSGPISYDVISLFKDAFRSWPQPRVHSWIQLYWQRARKAGLPVGETLDDFRVSLDWMGVQRHLKVMGIFARLTHRDGKPQYVADTPRFVRYIMDVAPRYAELRGLVDIFERHVLPAVALTEFADTSNDAGRS